MDSLAPTVVRLSAVEDVLGVLPYRIGFVPTESIVVMCLQGPRLRDRLVVRADLLPTAQERAVVPTLLAAVARAEASAAIVVCYTESADDDGLPRRSLVDHLAARLGDRGVSLVDAVLVRGGRRWSYHCADEACCPSAGTVLPDRLTPAAGSFAAEAVSEGRAPLPDREALAASICPPADAIAPAARAQAYDRAADRVIEVLAGSGPEALRQETLGLLRAVLARWSAGSRQLSPDEAATLVLGLRDRRTRDEGITLGLDADTEVYLSLFIQLARHAEAPDAPPVCTMLAWAAHAHGDGALAAVAVERALAADPGYVLAQLVQAGLAGLIRPEQVRAVAAQVREDLGGAGGPGSRRSQRRRKPS